MCSRYLSVCAAAVVALSLCSPTASFAQQATLIALGEDWTFFKGLAEPTPDEVTKEPTTVNSNQNVKDAAEILADGNFHALPVVDDEGNLVGMVTSADLIKYLLDQY